MNSAVLYGLCNQCLLMWCNDHIVFQDTVLALQAMAELSVMTFSADSLSLDISLQAGGVNYKYDTISKATAGILQSKQVRLCCKPYICCLYQQQRK